MLAGKLAAWYITHSAAILSDAVESIAHVVAVGFAAFSMRLSFRPADSKFHYGYERITFFSAGFEGGMIILAAVLIIWEAVDRWRTGYMPANLETGTWIIAAASVVNLVLGLYVLRTGRRTGSLILEANGKHVLTDSWTSFGVTGGLLLVIWTGRQFFDPLLAIIVAVNILWSGGGLVWRSARGLMDYADPELGASIQRQLQAICEELDIRYHELRYRHTGGRVLIEMHLLFPFGIPLGRAHRLATEVEQQLASKLEVPVSIVTHLEALEDHDLIHKSGKRADER
jgi:cation diffusion facilitator family transporter